MDKFADRVKPGGLLLYESGNILKPSMRSDIDIVPIDATTEALLMKNAKVMNMIVLGAYLSLKPVVRKESVMVALEKVLPEKYHHLLKINHDALDRGESLVKNSVYMVS
jgi:2-oxoglutarate ferredoxin oxidoreductase subunit gamma